MVASSESARHGWSGSLTDFLATDSTAILGQLSKFIRDANQQQVDAWRESIQFLKTELPDFTDADPNEVRRVNSPARGSLIVFLSLRARLVVMPQDDNDPGETFFAVSL